MNDWLATLRDYLRCEGAAVRITVAATRGSAPRDAGACMLVGAQWEKGTIGGGHLELMATAIARDMLAAETSARGRLDRFPLGATLGQCCGGIVELWFERFDSTDLSFLEKALAVRAEGGPLVLATVLSPAAHAGPHSLLRGPALHAANDLLQPGAAIARLQRAGGSGSEAAADILYERIDLAPRALWLFGAGHVGKALVKAFADLPFALTWVDGREAMFPEDVPGNVRILSIDDPADAAFDAPAGAMFLVLTHSHDLDFEVCRRILLRGDFAWAGLIGSKTKAARFVRKMRQRGFPEAEIARFACPIGVDGIDSKLPAVIAVSVAAQVLQVAEALDAQSAGSNYQAKNAK